MTGLRKSILFLFVDLTILFNLERFDFGDQNSINIQTFVYVLAFFAVLTTLLFKSLRHIPAYVSASGWTVVYFALKFVFLSNRPIFGDIYTYITITEVSLLVITVLMAYHLGQALHNFEEVIEQVTIRRLGQRVLPMKEAAEEIKTEFVRSRRHNRPLAVMVVDMDMNHSEITLQRTVKEIQKRMLARYLSAGLAHLLTEEVRRTDMILAEENQNGFVLLCPETTAEGLYPLVDRIQNTAESSLGIKVQCGVSAFPEEALTFDELLNKARTHIIATEDLQLYPAPFQKAEAKQVE